MPPIITNKINAIRVLQHDLAGIENSILMRVQHHLVGDIVALEHLLPLAQIQEAVVEGNPCGDVITLHDLGDVLGPGQNVLDRQIKHERLINEAIDRNNVLVAVLREERGELVVQFQRAVAVEFPIRTIQPVNRALVAAVVPPVLAAHQAVQVKFDAQAVLAAVLDGAEEVAPGDAGDIGFARGVCFHSPVGVLDANVVEACVADVDEVLLRDEFGVVLFQRGGCVGA